VPLSEDHKPDSPAEMERITATGAAVTKTSAFGAGRVWLPPECGGYGLAMGRSLGDFVFRPFGIIPNPDVRRSELHPDDRWLVIASDGVWEFVGSAQAVRTVDAHDHATEACIELIRLSAAAWFREEGKFYRDDITALVVKLPLLPLDDEVLHALGHTMRPVGDALADAELMPLHAADALVDAPADAGRAGTHTTVIVPTSPTAQGEPCAQSSFCPTSPVKRRLSLLDSPSTNVSLARLLAS